MNAEQAALLKLIPVTSFGAGFVGFGFACVLCGTMMAQVYVYYKSEHGKRDKPLLKCLVAAVFLLDILQLITQAVYLYDGLITNYATPNWFLRAPWSFILATGLSVFISSPVQLFYAWRVFVLSRRSPWLPGFISVVSISSFGFCMATMIMAFKIVDVARFDTILWIVDSWLGCTITADVIIVTSLTYYLTRGRTGYSNTDIVIDKLLYLTVHTGLLPTIFELGHLISFSIAPNNYAHLVFNFITPQLYANSFAATLNARTFLLPKMEAARAAQRHQDSMMSRATAQSRRFSKYDVSLPVRNEKSAESLQVKVTETTLTSVS